MKLCFFVVLLYVLYASPCLFQMKNSLNRYKITTKTTQNIHDIKIFEEDHQLKEKSSFITFKGCHNADSARICRPISL